MKFTQAFAAIVAVASAVNTQKFEIDDAKPALAQFEEHVLADMERSEVLAQKNEPLQFGLSEECKKEWNVLEKKQKERERK